MKPLAEDGAAGHRWSWAHLDEQGRVLDSGSGFYTIVAAVHDARTRGFTGEAEVGDPQVLLEHFGDRRAFAICTAY